MEKMNFWFILDYIGHTGPYITFIITSLYLLFISNYLFLAIYSVGVLCNLQIIAILKNWIREPRPKNPVPYIDHAFVGPHVYGMPSGHAEICFFNITFLWLTLFYRPKIWWILYISVGITLLTLYQRWKYRRHTIEQLAVGSLVGILFGGLAHQIANYSYVCNLW